MGVELETSSVYTAAAAAAVYVLKNFGGRPRVFNLATEGVQELLEGQADWVQGEGEKCDAVLIGARVESICD